MTRKEQKRILDANEIPLDDQRRFFDFQRRMFKKYKITYLRTKFLDPDELMELYEIGICCRINDISNIVSELYARVTGRRDLQVCFSNLFEPKPTQQDKVRTAWEQIKANREASLAIQEWNKKKTEYRNRGVDVEGLERRFAEIFPKKNHDTLSPLYPDLFRKPNE